MPKKTKLPDNGLFKDDPTLLPEFQKLLGRKAEVVLIFDTAKDGWNCNSFHSSCNGKGPTVSIARLADGTICGGYAESPWASTNGYRRDSNAFIFRLTWRGQKLAPYKATQVNDPNAIHDHSGYGPTFGGGHDLMFWNGNSGNNGTVNQSSYQYPPDPQGGSYPLTGSYGYTSLNSQGGYNVQVYQVLQKSSPTKYTESTLPPLLYSSPPPFGPDELANLRDEILATAQDSPPNLLLFGPVGSGKSSLVRSLMEVVEDNDDAGGIVAVGTGEGSVTKTLMQYDLEMPTRDNDVRVQERSTVIAKLWDTAGIEVGASSKLYKEGDLMRLLQGHFPAGTDLMTRLDDCAKDFNHHPTEGQRIHGVIMCIASTDISDEDKAKEISYFNTIVRQRGIPSMLVITKVDAYDPDLLNGGLCDPDDVDDQPGEPLDMRQLYRSLSVKELMDEAEKNTGFALVDMVPVANKTPEDIVAIGMPKACQLAAMLKKVLKRSSRFRVQEAKIRPQSAPPRGPSRFDAESFVSVSGLSGMGSVSTGSKASVGAALTTVCQELGLELGSDIKTMLKEANDALGLSPEGNMIEQVRALVSTLGLPVPGW